MNSLYIELMALFLPISHTNVTFSFDEGTHLRVLLIRYAAWFAGLRRSPHVYLRWVLNLRPPAPHAAAHPNCASILNPAL